MIPRTAGTYKARPVNWGAGLSKNKALEWACDFQIIGMWDGSQLVQCDANEISGHFYPMTKTGEVNEAAAKNLQECIGWDGTVRHLNDGDFSGCEVWLVCDFEEYEGQNRMKVKWMNPGSDAPRGQAAKADLSTVRTLESMFGSKLRAAGITKQPGARPNGNGKPAMQSEADIAKRAAWDAFKTKNSDATAADLSALWIESVKTYFNKPPEHITAGEWRQFAADGFKALATATIPADAGFKEDDIPF